MGLKTLNLSGNAISDIDKGTFSRLLDLTELNLSYNNITILNNDMLLGLEGCEKMYFQHNQIKQIYPLTFVEMVGLKTVDLTVNKLGEVDENVFNKTSLSPQSKLLLKLSNNTLR